MPQGRKPIDAACIIYYETSYPGRWLHLEDTTIWQ